MMMVAALLINQIETPRSDTHLVAFFITPSKENLPEIIFISALTFEMMSVPSAPAAISYS
jgi:hypothetical protein